MAADGTLLVAALVIGVGAALLVRGRLRPVRMRVLVAVAAGGIGFQVFHFAEHLAQLGYWIAHPTAAPWLSPWALAGVDVLAWLTDDRHGSGAELLHLVGNLIFLAGLVAALVLARARPRQRTRLLRLALWVQAAHVAEHVALTATWFVAGRALGVSSVFGALAADATAGIAARVWFHFAINLAATVLALRGIQQRWSSSGNHPHSRHTPLHGAGTDHAASAGVTSPPPPSGTVRQGPRTTTGTGATRA